MKQMLSQTLTHDSNISESYFYLKSGVRLQVKKLHGKLA